MTVVQMYIEHHRLDIIRRHRVPVFYVTREKKKPRKKPKQQIKNSFYIFERRNQNY